MDQEPIVNAFIASFLAFGGAVDEATLQRTRKNLRALIYDPDPHCTRGPFAFWKTSLLASIANDRAAAFSPARLSVVVVA